VVGQNTDDVLGVISLWDVLDLPAAERSGRTAGELARPAHLIPDTVPLSNLITRWTVGSRDDELLCLVDEYGGLAGVITMEDVAEELVGEIGDELDPDDSADEPHAEPDGGWTVPGQTSIEEVSRLIGRELPEGRYATLGGLLIDRLGRLAEPGDVVRVSTEEHGPDDEGDVASVELEVQSLRRHVPASIRIRLTAEPAAGRENAALHAVREG